MVVVKGSEYIRKIKPSEKRAMAKKAQSQAVQQQRASEPAGADVERQSNARPLAEFPDLMDVLPDLAKRYREIHEQGVAIEKEKKELGGLIMPLLEAVGHDSITDEDWNAVRCRGANVQISKTKLIELGVDPEIVAKATVKSTYYYLQVRKVGGVSDQPTEE